jgi:predicted metal-binding protein
MSKAIFELVNELPEKNLTTTVLKALDFIVPGEWQNIHNFEEMIRIVTKETDEQMIQAIGDRAVWLFNDKTQGYQNALWLYQTVDTADYALGAAALANKVAGKIKLLSFMERLTPNNEKSQQIDLLIKLVVEVVAFCQINGLPGNSIADFVKALKEYEADALMRMGALVCIDAIIPFGADFIQKIESTLQNLSIEELTNNPTFAKVSSLIPGNSGGKLDFINSSFDASKTWMSEFVAKHNLTQSKLMGNLSNFVDFSENQLDYVAAFLDMSTNYFEHTGIQSIARSLISRAMFEV